MLTVAQLVEHQIVVLVVVSSILIRQPNREVVQSGRMRALGARGRRFESCRTLQKTLNKPLTFAIRFGII